MLPTFAALTDESVREGWPWVATGNVVASVGRCFAAFWAVNSATVAVLG